MKADLAQGDKSAFVLLPQLSGGASKACGYELGVVSVKNCRYDERGVANFKFGYFGICHNEHKIGDFI
jgi:hypothetical protein